MKKWNGFFEKDSYPDYPCPTCEIGVLKKSKILKDISVKQPVFHDDNGGYNEYEYYRNGKKFIFSSILKCGNKECQQIVSMIGDYLENYEDFDVETLGTNRFSSYFPKYFYPNLKIFNYPENLPKRLEEEINNSFANYFSDTASSANKIRRAIEILVTALGAPKYTLTQKINPSTRRRKKLFFELHTRITKLNKSKTRTSEMLLGLKVIGNEGSHYNESKIKQKDILEAYEVLGFILQKEFTDKEKEILQKAENLKNRQ